jgi:RNA polymerase sigma-70 factor (ECF subfamily)
MMALGMRTVPPTKDDASPRELDAAALARCKAGDPMAFRAFVLRYERPVFALLSRMLGRGPHIEDLAQETFLRAFRALPDFDAEHGARASTWLLTIATRLALDARKRKTIPSVPLDEVRPVQGSATPEGELGRARMGRAIVEGVSALSDDQRAAFVLAEFHGLSLAEIARAVGVSENTIKTRLFRAREHMRERLAAWREEMSRG